MSETPSIGCVVLAAGCSSRFGSNKLLHKVQGKTLIRRTLEAVPAELLQKVAVVTRFPAVTDLAKEFGFSVVQNPNPELGMSHSIRLGLAAVSDCDSVLFLVADQPYLTRSTLSTLIACHREAPNGITAASCGDFVGNPGIFSRRFYPEFSALQQEQGGRQILRRHPDCVRSVPVPPQELQDLDTPDSTAL